MVKRSFKEIRDILLLELTSSRKTINKLSDDTGVNWKTTQHHLTYLLGKQMVKEVFSSPYARIFELSELGNDYVSMLDGDSEEPDDTDTKQEEESINNRIVTLKVIR